MYIKLGSGKLRNVLQSCKIGLVIKCFTFLNIGREN